MKRIWFILSKYCGKLIAKPFLSGGEGEGFLFLEND